MKGLHRVLATLTGAPCARPPVFPIIHAGLASVFGVSPANFATSATAMADVMCAGIERFGFDGAQLSLGVIGEAEALGAATLPDASGVPRLDECLLPDLNALDSLRARDPRAGGRMPLFHQALSSVSAALGDQAFVLATLRGPLLMASQLRGVEAILIDMIESPEDLQNLLRLTTDVAASLGAWLLSSGAHGLILGEATCSPNFIPPKAYRQQVAPHHRALVSRLRAAGWDHVGLHICGDVRPILDDIVGTGVTFADIDHAVPASEALALVGGRIALRGNIDPCGVLRFGAASDVQRATRALCDVVSSARWIVGSGCDIPPGTPVENIHALVAAARHGIARA